MIKITISLLFYAIFVSQATFAAPLPPNLSSPADYSIYNRNDISSVVFSWSSVSGALEYWLNVFPEGDSSNPKFNNSVSGTSLSVPVSSSWTSAIYIWQVRVRTSAGWSSYSTARQFIVDYPPGPPTLNSPASGASFPIGGSSDFTWTAPSGGTVERYTFRIVSGTDLNQDQNRKIHQELPGTTDSLMNVSFSDSLYDPGTHTWAVRAIKKAPPGYSQSTYETTVKWGQYATRTFSIASPPSAPNLSLPADYSIYNRNDTSSVIFSWSSVSGALEYWLNVFPEGDSSNPKFNNSVSGTSLSVPVSSSWTSAIYIWQVRVRTSAGWSSYSTARQFIVDYPPGPPTLNSPASGTSFPIAGSSDFTWTAPSGGTVERYTFRIVSGTDLNQDLNVKMHKELAGTTDNESFSDSLYDPGTHTWAVRAIKKAPLGYSQSTYETTVRWGEYATRTFTVTLPVTGNPVFIPLYRSYSSTAKDHFYTTSATERDTAVGKGYVYERIEGFVSSTNFFGSVPLYRLYHVSQIIHYYTTNEDEKAIKVAAGYTSEGITGYIYPTQAEWTTPLYHSESTANTDHFYTTSKYEYQNSIKTWNFDDGGITGYVATRIANNRPQGNFAGVGMAVGNLSLPSFTDLSLNGVGPQLSFTRYYDSFSPGTTLGQGWSFNYDSYLKEDDSGEIHIEWGNGSESHFDSNLNPYPGYFEKAKKETISGYGYDITTKDQTVYKFRQYTLDTPGPDILLNTITDRYGNSLILDRFASYGVVISATDSTGRKLYYSYTPVSLSDGRIVQRLTKVTDTSLSPNRAINLDYNAQGNLSSVTDARNNITLYTYNPDGLLSGITYPEGNRVIINYNVLGQVIGYTADNITLTFGDYNTATGTTVKNGNTTLANYMPDTQYRVERINFPADNSNIQMTYLTGNYLNLQSNVKDRNDKITSFTYDANGNVLTVKNARNEITTYTYDIWNNLTSVTDPRNTTPATSDAYKTKFIYDGTGNFLQSIRKPMGGTTNFIYFTNNGLVQTVTDPTNHKIIYSYDANGNVAQIKDDALSTFVDFTNDGAGRRLTQNDQHRPNSQLTTWVYDNNDNVTSVQVDSHPAAIFRYDKNNRLYNVVDQKSQTTVYTYNLANLLETQTSPDQKKWQYGYDSLGKLSSIVLPDGNGITYTYDDNNRLQFVRYNGTEKLEYSYDNNGNIRFLQADNTRTTLFDYDEVNRIASITDPFNNVIGYGYDPAGNRARITYPGNNVVTYTFDADNRLATVKDWLGSALTTYTYNTAGILQSISNANGTTATFGYDAANRLISLANKKYNKSNIASYTISQLDNVGNPLSVTRNEPLAPPIPTASDVYYEYSNANQIQSAGSITYSHDDLGNLSGASNGSIFAFDYANHLMSATVGSDTFSFLYDGLGNRISRTTNGTQTRYILDLNAQMSNVLAETNASGVVQNYYVHGLGLISRINNSGQRFTYHYDTIGNTVAVTDDSNAVAETYTYDDFGHVLVSRQLSSVG